MKLISVNVEGNRHLDLVYSFIKKENPDVICIQEGTDKNIEKLEQAGYHTAFLQRSTQEKDGEQYVDGCIVAAKSQFNHSFHTYYDSGEQVPVEIFAPKDERLINNQGFVFAAIDTSDGTYHIASNHFTWTPEGSKPSKAQTIDMESFLALIQTLPPHVMCGDFNIPRLHNSLYKKLTEYYKDDIPPTYRSSLDKNIHRIGNDPSKAIMFEEYMVDYVFSLKPYVVRNVRLEFGISDHAAVVCEISKE